MSELELLGISKIEEKESIAPQIGRANPFHLRCQRYEKRKQHFQVATLNFLENGWNPKTRWILTQLFRQLAPLLDLKK